MSEFIFKLPDLGEGTVEAEIIEWYVQVGDTVQEGAPMADVMTDKANVEVPAPVSGTLSALGGAVGDVIAVGAPLAVFATGEQNRPEEQSATTELAPTADASDTTALPPRSEPQPEPLSESASAPNAKPDPTPNSATSTSDAKSTTETPSANLQGSSQAKVLTSPAIRKRAAEAGIDLQTVAGSGPRGRILRKDFDKALANVDAGGTATAGMQAASTSLAAVEQINVRGVRRVIAQRMAASKRTIPHFTYVEEVDVTALDALRQQMNRVYAEPAGQPNLTYLPFVGMALMRALQDHPLCNAHYRSDDEVIDRFAAVHLGIATQTPDGLKVPVVHNAQNLSLWQLAEGIRTLTSAAREGTATRQQLSGSSITLTSLGKLGGIVSTPIINAPEVAIVGLNKAVSRPVVVQGNVAVRTMMNISGSFDHRIIDGFDAASFVGSLKTLLEEPGLIFAPKP